MTAEVAMLMLLLNHGVCTETSHYWHNGEKVQTLRCQTTPPHLSSEIGPYRVGPRDRS